MNRDLLRQGLTDPVGQPEAGLQWLRNVRSEARAWMRAPGVYGRLCAAELLVLMAAILPLTLLIYYLVPPRARAQ